MKRVLLLLALSLPLSWLAAGCGGDKPLPSGLPESKEDLQKMAEAQRKQAMPGTVQPDSPAAAKN